jgi:hypothetical protein
VLALVAVSGASAATWWHPPQQLTWYWQLSGTPAVQPVQATDVDGFDTSAATVAAFHARGQRMICYIDVGTAENWRSDYASFPSSVLGATNGWPGEQWLDIRQLSVLEPIMTARLQMCQQKGFDAVEPDNMDGYANTTGFPLQASDQLAYNEWIAGEAHALGMAVLQKNDSDQAAALQPYFDGVLDEQCNQYSACSAYEPYLSAGKPVLNAEYSGGSSFCAADSAAGIMGALYATILDGSVYQPCFGPSTTTPITGPPAPPTAGALPTAPVVAPVHRAIPRMRILGGGRLPVVRGMVRITLACPAGESYCAGRLTLRTARRLSVGGHTFVALGARTFRLAGGHHRTLRIKLSQRAIHRLRSAASIAVVITVAAHDKRGRHATVHRRLTMIFST